MDINCVHLLGNVGKDPEIRTTQAGNKVANFSLATNERWRDKGSNEQKERTDWHRIVVWGDKLVSAIVEPYVTKGSRLWIRGKIQTRSYEKDGTTRYITEIVVSGFDGQIGLEGGKGDAAAGQGQQASPSPQPAGADLDDEIPF